MDEPHKRKDWPTDPVQVCSPVCGPNTTRRILISPSPPPTPCPPIRHIEKSSSDPKLLSIKKWSMVYYHESLYLTKNMWTLTLHPAWLYGKTIYCSSSQEQFCRFFRKTSSVVGIREYWMIYGGPGFLVVIWFVSPPRPVTHRKIEKERQFAAVGGGEVGGEEPDHTTTRKPGPLKLFNTLWSASSFKYWIRQPVCNIHQMLKS